MKTLTIGELYAAVEGKTERSEIEAILTKASIAVLKEYLNNEAGYKAYDGMSTWRKADYVEAATETTLDKIAFEEEHDKLIQQIAEENASASCEVLTHSQMSKEEEYVASLDTSASTLPEVSAGVEKYESGKLTEGELSELLSRATAETLREYILKEIVSEKGQKNAA